MAASYMHLLICDDYITFTDVVHVMLLGSIDNVGLPLEKLKLKDFPR